MADEGNNIVTFIFTGEEERHEWGGYIIPQNVTHLIIHESVSVIPALLCMGHQNIVELICHAGVKIIEEIAFRYCPQLQRVIIPGVVVIEREAFCGCEALTDVVCPKLEIIEDEAFNECTSLSSINLSSAKFVRVGAFNECDAMTNVKFGKNLESIGKFAFLSCRSLERVTIPLKKGVVDDCEDDIFNWCGRLKSVDLVEKEALQETINALQLEEWRNDMETKIDSINQILPNTGDADAIANYHKDGEKTKAIRVWIERVLRKIIHYKAQHRLLLREAFSALQLTALPSDIVMDNVLSFLELPSYTFEGEGEDEAESFSSSNDDSKESYCTSEDEVWEEDGDSEDESVVGEDDEGGRKRRKTANVDEGSEGM